MLTVRLSIILIVLLLAVPARPAGTDPGADPRQGAPPTGEENQPAAQSDPPPLGAERGSDSFTPSEKVSEDLAVAFPVDI